MIIALLSLVVHKAQYSNNHRHKCTVVSALGSVAETIGCEDLISMEWGKAFPVEVIIRVSSNG